MKKLAGVIISHSAIIIIVLQIFGNLLFFIDKDWYNANGFYLNFAIGTNAFYPLVILCMCYRFRFCRVSIFCAAAEVLMAIYYLVVQKDDIYNIMVQVTLGVLSLLLTVVFYGKLKSSKVARFFYYIFTEDSCDAAIEKYLEQNKNK